MPVRKNSKKTFASVTHALDSVNKELHTTLSTMRKQIDAIRKQAQKHLVALTKEIAKQEKNYKKAKEKLGTLKSRYATRRSPSLKKQYAQLEMACRQAKEAVQAIKLDEKLFKEECKGIKTAETRLQAYTKAVEKVDSQFGSVDKESAATSSTSRRKRKTTRVSRTSKSATAPAAGTGSSKASKKTQATKGKRGRPRKQKAETEAAYPLNTGKNTKETPVWDMTDLLENQEMEILSDMENPA